MWADPTARAGFARPSRHHRARRRRTALFAHAIASAALLASIVVAVTVVSIGIARADALMPLGRSGATATAFILAVVLAGAAGLATAARAVGRRG
jgi:hypothetical protein